MQLSVVHSSISASYVKNNIDLQYKLDYSSSSSQVDNQAQLDATLA